METMFFAIVNIAYICFRACGFLNVLLRDVASCPEGERGD